MDVFELDISTIALMVPMKFKRRGSFSPTSAFRGQFRLAEHLESTLHLWLWTGGGGVEGRRMPAARRFRSCRSRSCSAWALNLANDRRSFCSRNGPRIFSSKAWMRLSRLSTKVSLPLAM